MKVRYKSGYKFQLAEDYFALVITRPKADFEMPYCRLLETGHFMIESGYAWNGMSGPIPNLPSTIEASLVHDALYQLIRVGGLDPSYRKQCDKILRHILIINGMPHIFAQIIYMCVRLFGAKYIKPDEEPRVKEA